MGVCACMRVCGCMGVWACPVDVCLLGPGPCVQVVSKVSLHVCDDGSARATGSFLGLRASVYLSAIDQNEGTGPDVS